MFVLIFIAGKMKWKFLSGVVWDKQPIQLKPIILDYACADVSFHYISFRVVLKCNFITQNEMPFLSK